MDAATHARGGTWISTTHPNGPGFPPPRTDLKELLRLLDQACHEGLSARLGPHHPPTWVCTAHPPGLAPHTPTHLEGLLRLLNQIGHDGAHAAHGRLAAAAVKLVQVAARRLLLQQPDGPLHVENLGAAAGARRGQEKGKWGERSQQAQGEVERGEGVQVAVAGTGASRGGKRRE
eukprot:359339-Chlamydomonas_euryale.AAC.1